MAGVDKTCTITNTYIVPAPAPVTVYYSSGGGSTHYGCTDPKATNYEAFAATSLSLCIYGVMPPTPVVAAPLTATVVPVAPIIAPVKLSTPKLPNTGLPPEQSDIWGSVILVGIVVLVSSTLFAVLKKNNI